MLIFVSTQNSSAMPNAKTIPDSQALHLLKTTPNSITIAWDDQGGTSALEDDTRIYQVGITEEENPADPWHIVQEKQGLRRYTFDDLKEDTSYGIFVKAYDETGLVCQYPVYRGCLTVRTLAPDTQAPTADIRGLNVLESSKDRIIISWNPATDDRTAAENILYKVYIKESNNPSDPVRLAREEKGITTHTFTGLKDKTKYTFYVLAYDEAGNMLRYPLDNGSMTAVTDSANPKVVFMKLDEILCDGSSGQKSTFLKATLGSGFKRNYFELSFEFYPLSTDQDSSSHDNILTLDSSYRALSLFMKKGAIYARINNGKNEVAMGIGFKPNRWQSFWLTYDNGRLIICGGLVERQIGSLTGNVNDISSVNSSNAHSFHGYLRNVIVKSK